MISFKNMVAVVETGKGQEDGIYILNGIIYRVRDHKVTHLAVDGRITEPYGTFEVDHYKDEDEAISILKQIED